MVSANYTVFQAAYKNLISRFPESLTQTVGECFETALTGNDNEVEVWVAFNPHNIRCHTSRGQRLEPKTCYIEVDNEPHSMFTEEGGLVISGKHANSGDIISCLAIGGRNPSRKIR